MLVKMVNKRLGKDEDEMVLYQRPAFFKIFNQLVEKRLEIPPQFARDVIKEMPKRVILEGPYGNRRSVKVVKTDDGDVFLEADWQKFVEDNLLKEHDFLLFSYDHGARCLTVQSFDKSGVERNYASASRTNQEGANSGIKNLDEHTRHGRPRGKGQSREEGAKLQEFCSQHPFFETHIKGYNVRPPLLMRIPKSFAEKHFQKAKTTIKMKNTEGKEWEVNYTINNESFVFVGGWSRFVRDNKLKVGNVCIFELIDEKLLQVHIFR